MSDEEFLAKAFHEVYERLAPSFGYETRKESSRPWAKVPEKNRRLMIAVCKEVFPAEIGRRAGASRDQMLRHIEIDTNREGDCDLKRWLRRILGGVQ